MNVHNSEKKYSATKGFTLIEVLLVVALIAIVAGIVIYAINPSKSLNKVKSYEALTGQQEIESALTQYSIDNSVWPTGIDADLSALGTDVGDCQSDYSYYEGAEEESETDCVDISSDLVPRYLVGLPRASNADTDEQVGYAVKIVNSRPKVYIKKSSLEEVGGTAGDFDISGGGGSGGSGDDAPAVSNVQLVTPLQANVETTVSYTYTDNETDPEGQSTIAAYQADDALGTNSSQIISGTDTEITPPLSSENKFIRIGVTPIATSGTTPGVEVFSNWEGPVSPAPFQSVNGLVVIKSTSATTAPGTGTFSSKVWTLESGTDGTNQYYTALANSGNSTGDSLVGPRIDHDINFTETGTYRVYLRMNGPSGSDDSVHVSIDNDPLTFGRYGLSRSGWGWISTVNGRPGPDEVEFTITSPGVKTVSVWMREDGVRYDCMVLKHITLQGTANLSSSPCPAETGV